MYGQNTSCTGIGEDGDEDVLLDIERARIQGELKWGTLEEDSVGDGRGHEVAQRHHSDLGRCGSEGDWLPSVAKELVDEGEEDAGENA